MADPTTQSEPDPGPWPEVARTSDLALQFLHSRRRNPWAERVAIALDRVRTPTERDRLAHSQADTLAEIINAVLDGLELTPEQHERGIDIAVTELRRASEDDPPWAG